MRLIACCLALLLIGLSAGAVEVLAERPTPLHWDPWQPQTDSSDARLDRLVSAAYPEVTAAAALDAMSCQTGVSFAIASDQSSLEISCFVDRASLSSWMSSLAKLIDGYWVYLRGAEPRVYCLTTSRPTPDLGDESFLYVVRRQMQLRNEPYREDRLAQIDACRAALALCPEEVMRRFGETDPWLCAYLLDPGLRPVLARVSELSTEKVDELVTYGETSEQLSSLDQALVRHFALWSKGEFGGVPGYMTPPIDPDTFTRFESAEDAWRNAWVKYVWLPDGLQVQLEVPDHGRWFTSILKPRGTDPFLARRRLVRLGLEDASAERLSAIEAEHREWQRLHGSGPGASGSIVPAGPRLPRPWEQDARLARRLDLGEGDAQPGVRRSALLQQIAAQCSLQVIAFYSPPDDVIGLPPECTAAAALAAISRSRGGADWRLSGRYLLLMESDPDLFCASQVPAELVRRVEQLVGGGATIAVDELATLITELNPMQVERLRALIPSLTRLPLRLRDLRLLGSFSSRERESLGSGGALSFRGLTRRQQGLVLAVARTSHPGVGPEDLQGAEVLYRQTVLATGEEGLSLIVAYGSPSWPRDQDELLRAPLRIRLGG